MRYIYLLLLAVVFTSCAKEFRNPYDPATPPEIWMPKAFKLDTLGSNALRLSWNQYERHIDGFTIQKSINGQLKEILLPLDSLRYTDTNLFQDSGIVHYKVWARAGNNKSDEVGTVEGINFPMPILYDIEGNKYRIIKIGNQKWIGDNLRATRFSNGDQIPLINNNFQWGAQEAYCEYPSTYLNSIDKIIMGNLYNWSVITDTRNVCPIGWHVPTDEEWTILTDYLGGSLIAGDKMKSIGTIEAGNGFWHTPNNGATNESGFTGQPGGCRNNSGAFSSIGNFGYWWSSSQFDIDNAWYRFLGYDSSYSGRGNILKKNGFSVRCIKD